VFKSCPEGRRRLIEAFAVKERPAPSTIRSIDAAVEIIFGPHSEVGSRDDTEWFPMPVVGDESPESQREAGDGSTI
jgi:hypothetical protein